MEADHKKRMLCSFFPQIQRGKVSMPIFLPWLCTVSEQNEYMYLSEAHLGHTVEKHFQWKRWTWVAAVPTPSPGPRRSAPRLLLLRRNIRASGVGKGWLSTAIPVSPDEFLGRSLISVWFFTFPRISPVLWHEHGCLLKTNQNATEQNPLKQMC